MLAVDSAIDRIVNINHSAMYYPLRYKLAYMHCRGCANEVINEPIKLNCKEPRNDVTHRMYVGLAIIHLDLSTTRAEERWKRSTNYT